MTAAVPPCRGRRPAPSGARRAGAIAAALITTGGTGLLAGCGPAQSLTAAPSAGSPACAVALAAAPERVLAAPRVPLDVTGALAWGSPPVTLRCGLAAPGPTTLACVEVNGVDWVLDPGADPMIATTYGRTPAVEIRVPAERGQQSLSDAMVDVTAVASALPRSGRACVG